MRAIEQLGRTILADVRRLRGVGSTVRDWPPDLEELANLPDDVPGGRSDTTWRGDLPAQYPAGMPCAGVLGDTFGPRFHPILKRFRQHKGEDIRAAVGTPVKATAAGTVARAGIAGGFGLLVELVHSPAYRTRYAHLSSVLVHGGQQVQRGALLGLVGQTGLATGPHLHYEVLVRGVAVDPAPYLGGRMKYAEGLVSFYGQPGVDRFYGRTTASGEPLTYPAKGGIPTVAHKSLPFGTLVKFRNPDTGAEVVARVNDRGPYVGGREFDLSFEAAQRLGIVDQGVARVQYAKVDKP